MASTLESKFALYWQGINGPPLLVEHRFHPTRKWRFDFAHPETMTAIEIEGGLFAAGRHGRGRAYQADCEKYNEALFLGWRVFRLGTDQVTVPLLCRISDFITRNQKPA